MQTYGTKDLTRLMGVSPGTVRSMVKAGYLAPRRGPRGVMQFSFQDLVVLRTVRGLTAARISSRRINRCLRALRRQLPAAAPLAGLSITAVGEDIAVREGLAQWDGSSGQFLLAFDVRVDAGHVSIVEQPRAAPSDCAARFAVALRLEDSDIDGAITAYRECLAADASLMAACINLGRLLYLAGRLEEAERVYRAIEQPDALLLFNLGILLEDLRRPADAIDCYRRAIDMEPTFHDAHYNLARLYELAGNQRESLRHLNAFRRLAP